MKTSFWIFLTVILAGLSLAWYVGAFTTMNITEKTEGGFVVAGLEFTGPYAESGKIMADVEGKVKGLGITSTRGFGIYYDDPKVTPAEKCRSYVGAILEEKDKERIDELKAAGLRIDTLAESEAVVTFFPARTSWSYMIGPMKAYPALSKYMAEKNYELTLSLEIYDRSAGQIEYVMQYKK